MSGLLPTRRFVRLVRGVGLLTVVVVLASSRQLVPGAEPAAAAETQANPFAKINHVVVIYQENWSFDSLYGYLPGANGLAQASSAAPQVDRNGVPYATLPQPLDSTRQFAPDNRFPTDLPNAPFDVN